jgi:hypothetical protein
LVETTSRERVAQGKFKTIDINPGNLKAYMQIYNDGSCHIFF